ncbi:DNA binding domain-containing protein, excisionase family [Mariprofundus aestuarium]|uniref:DNA binding domain-containing protein, excisionase family n=1 Tax=Mariprofundus aestuarium TaxID=1921086 RepID=A0A2K8KX69_MARES|nr:response regulator [Mariprofundus aestuarium]ATX79525.1 DNA binding domain-containing protein, excisionase family [Mariprofundus aestuarium]
MNRDEYLTTKQVAEMMDVTIRTVQLWADAGQLECWVSPGGHRRIRRDSAMQMLELRGVEGAGIDPGIKSVLIVEDDRDLILLYQMHFKRWGLPLDVRYAANGFIGLMEIGRRRPDLLVTDLFMPYMDGFQMLRSLNQEGLHIPTIVITGAPAGKVEALQAEDEDVLVLSKPVDFNLLRRLISVTLDVRKAEYEEVVK